MKGHYCHLKQNYISWRAVKEQRNYRTDLVVAYLKWM